MTGSRSEVVAPGGERRGLGRGSALDFFLGLRAQVLSFALRWLLIEDDKRQDLNPRPLVRKNGGISVSRIHLFCADFIHVFGVRSSYDALRYESRPDPHGVRLFPQF